MKLNVTSSDNWVICFFYEMVRRQGMLLGNEEGILVIADEARA